MSKELEMLRDGLAQFGRGAGALGFDVADLRRILARLEAAERVCDPLAEEQAIIERIAAMNPVDLQTFLDGGGDFTEIDDAQDALNKERQKCYQQSRDALAAYRALDAKETK